MIIHRTACVSGMSLLNRSVVEVSTTHSVTFMTISVITGTVLVEKEGQSYAFPHIS